MDQKISNSKLKQQIEKKVNKTIKKNNLFTHKDKVVVAVSGGKDSTVCLYILKKLGYDVEGLTIDVNIGDYTRENLKNLQEFCDQNQIKLNIVSFRDEFGMSLCYIQSILKSKDYNYSSCKTCGILKRYLLNKYARKLNFNAIATGHNLDDEAQSFIMNIFRNDFKLAIRQGSRTGIIDSDKFIKRVKPLYFVSESDIEKYSKLMGFKVNYGICPCSVGAYRRKYKKILNDFEKEHPHVKNNIIKFQEQLKNSVKPNNGKEKINCCENCDEPCSKELCKACQIILELKKS